MSDTPAQPSGEYPLDAEGEWLSSMLGRGDGDEADLPRKSMLGLDAKTPALKAEPEWLSAGGEEHDLLIPRARAYLDAGGTLSGPELNELARFLRITYTMELGAVPEQGRVDAEISNERFVELRAFSDQISDARAKSQDASITS